MKNDSAGLLEQVVGGRERELSYKWRVVVRQWDVKEWKNLSVEAVKACIP